MSFIEWSQLLHGIKLVALVLQDWQSSVISGLPVLKCVKSIRYSVFADRAAIAEELNPFTINQTAITNSCGNIPAISK